VNRTLRHLFTTARAISRAFPDAVLDRVESAVTQAEAGGSGQIRIGIEAALPAVAVASGYSARERAIDVFSQLRVWDTEHNNGVLIYLLMADKDVEIVADRGLRAKVSQAQWEAICRAMEAHFRAGACEGAQQVGALLREHFPQAEGRNEMPNRPYVFR
jgi:hypothetical protein